MPALMLDQRLATARNLITRERAVLHDVVGDVRARVNGNEPPHSRNMGGILGSRGSLVKAPVPLIARTVDNVLAFVQENARINHSHVPMVRVKDHGVI